MNDNNKYPNYLVARILVGNMFKTLNYEQMLRSAQCSFNAFCKDPNTRLVVLVRKDSPIKRVIMGYYENAQFIPITDQS